MQELSHCLCTGCECSRGEAAGWCTLAQLPLPVLRRCEEQGFDVPRTDVACSACYERFSDTGALLAALGEQFDPTAAYEPTVRALERVLRSCLWLCVWL